MSHKSEDCPASSSPEGAGEENGNAERHHFFDNPANVKRVICIFIALCVVMLLLDFVFLFEDKHLSFRHGEFAPEAFPGFYSVFGFVACVLLVLIAKGIRRVLMRAEDYYER